MLCFTARWLSLRLVYIAVDFYARLRFYLGDYARYMRNVLYFFPRLSDNEARHLARGILSSKHKTSVDFLYCDGLPKKKHAEMCIPEGLDELDEGLALGHGVIGFSFHGEHFPLAFYLAGRGYPINVSMWGRTASIAKRVYGNHFNVVSSFEEMKQCLNRNEVLLIVIDGLQGKHPVDVNFLGKKVLFSPGIILLAKKTGARIYPVDAWRQKDGKVRFSVFKNIDLDHLNLETSDGIREGVQKCVDFLEPYVIKNPARYFYIFMIERKIKYFDGGPSLNQFVRTPQIYTLPLANPAAREWNDSLAGDYLWTKANYGEAVPDVMTPCTWSLVQILLENLVLSYGPYHTYGNIGGCLYKNLSMEASFAAALRINQRRFARMIEESFGRLPEGLEIPIVRLSRGYLLRLALPVVIRSFFRMWANHRKLPAFLQAAPGRCEALRARIQATTSSEELVTLWHTDVAPFFYEACHMLETAVNSGGGAILSIRRNLQKLVGEDDTNILLTGLSTRSGPLASLGPLLDLTRLAKGKINRETFVRHFGHRGPHEMEVSIPRPGEKSNWIDKQLAGLRQAQDDATALLARQENQRKSAWNRLHQRYPRKEKSIRRKIDRWAAIARGREAARSEVIRTVWVLRSFVQRAGVLTGQGESIFFLSIDEILSVLGGDQTSLTYIPVRRAAYERYCALPPYPVLIRGRFDPFQWAANPERRSDMFDSLRGNMPVNFAITGLPGAAGVVEGKVRVIATAEDGDQLQAGEILVTTVTNVGWTPLFPRAAAVVTDVGAPLSHAAIVARELGISAVVGCGDATMRLKTGDWVRVDGGKGIVEIISAAQLAARADS
jgi:lauroyl/myristoyl acyltransferase/phosphohistidine swiveling domain-containing protein